MISTGTSLIYFAIAVIIFFRALGKLIIKCALKLVKKAMQPKYEDLNHPLINELTERLNEVETDLAIIKGIEQNLNLMPEALQDIQTVKQVLLKRQQNLYRMLEEEYLDQIPIGDVINALKKKNTGKHT